MYIKGATIPAVSYLLGRWSPPDERSVLFSIANTGRQLHARPLATSSSDHHPCHCVYCRPTRSHVNVDKTDGDTGIPGLQFLYLLSSVHCFDRAK